MGDIIAGSSLVWLHFDEQGNLVDPTALQALRDAVAVDGIEDLVVLSHGWQNDLPDARALYGTLWGNAATALAARGRDPRRIALAGVLWPAKKYDADYDGAAATDAQSAAGQVQSLGDGDAADDVPPAQFEAALAEMSELAGADAAQVQAVARVAASSGDPQHAQAFFATARAALGFGATPDAELAADARFFTRTDTTDGADALLSAFALPFTVDAAGDPGTTLGLADTIRSAYQGGRSAVLWALNKLTYYTMKARAGLIGEKLAALLAGVAPPRAVRLHLVGHSFGGRLVTSVAAHLPTCIPLDLRSLTLLQAAYSHNGLADGRGPFAAALTRPAGPIVATHTHNDLACTVAYPLASRLAGDTTKALGDANDPFGAMGANGPQHLAPGAIVAATAPDFALVKGKVNLVLADGFIRKTDTVDAHNNVTNPTCGALVAAAVAAG